MRGFGDIAERLRRSTVQIFNGSDQSRGSGIIWNAGGLILTNAHVARAPEAEIELWDGRRFPRRWLRATAAAISPLFGWR